MSSVVVEEKTMMNTGDRGLNPLNTNVDGGELSASENRRDSSHLGKHCLAFLTDYLQVGKLQPLIVVHDYAKKQLPLYIKVFNEECAGGVLFDEERAKIVVADDSASTRRVSNIHVDFVVGADVEEKLRQWKSGQWERNRCAQEYMALGYDARCIMGMVDRKEISKKRA